MKDVKQNIADELEALGASKLKGVHKSEHNIPESIKTALLDKIDFTEEKKVGGLAKILRIGLPLGVAAALLIGIFILTPSETKHLSFDDLSLDELEYMLGESLTDYSDNDLVSLADEETNILDYYYIDASYLEDELLDYDELEVIDLL